MSLLTSCISDWLASGAAVEGWGDVAVSRFIVVLGSSGPSQSHVFPRSTGWHPYGPVRVSVINRDNANSATKSEMA